MTTTDRRSPRPAATARPGRRGRHAGFGRPAAGRVDQDPHGALHGLDAVIFVVVMPRLHRAVHLADRSHWTGPRAAARDASGPADPIGFILGTGIGLGQLAICVLGVLVITSEYSTGVIRACCSPCRSGYRCWPPRRWCSPCCCSS